MSNFDWLSITSQDLALIGFLAFLEGILSVDNALVLALMVKPLPKVQQRPALTYGLLGSVVFRLMALGFVTHIMRWNWVKFVGGGYLLWIGAQHLIFPRGEETHDETGPKKKRGSFWFTVLKIELMDVAFAVDSILAAVAVSDRFWVIFTGGMLGVILMRFAATGFLKLLERFPNFDKTAYLLIGVVGIKLFIDGFHLEGVDFHTSESPAFWAFWGSMGLCIAYGFSPQNRRKLKKSKVKS